MKSAPDCTKAGCRMKAKYGFSAPPTYCKTDKLEGMHEITIEEMNSLSKPVQPSPDAVIVNVPSTILDSNEAPVPEEPTIQKVNETAGENEFENCGMKLNPHWVANEGKKPAQWRSFHSLKKNHPAEIKHFQFDLGKGGMVVCKDCIKFPHIADTSAKLFSGYFGMKTYGYKWEVFSAHLKTSEHAACVKEEVKITKGKVQRLVLATANYNPKNAINNPGRFQQVSRLINTVHTMVHKNIAITNFEDLIKMQLANGADMGDQY